MEQLVDSPITDELRHQLKIRAEVYLNTLVLTYPEPEPIVTAGTLRRFGIRIDLGIPDDAWMPLRSVKWSASTSAVNGSVLAIKFDCTTLEPFRWIKN